MPNKFIDYIKSLFQNPNWEPETDFEGRSDISDCITSYEFDDHMSINPASGLPMAGSSGLDIYGNPSGTDSWS